MDPPFFSNRNHERFGGDEYKHVVFDDNNWGYSFDGLKGKYLPYMRERIQKCYDVLKNTGSFYLHCDWHASHYLKQICDAIFGYNNFRNEIIWHYRTGGVSKRWYGRKHDTILFYTKSKNYTFNPLEVKLYYDSKPGLPDRNSGQDEKGYFHYVFQDDVIAVPAVFNLSNEFIGYPTQKPEDLLERIVKSSCPKNGIILDPFCGCGTTLAVAYKLNRHFIGVDISEKACRIVMDRLIKLGAEPKYHPGIYEVKQLKDLPPFIFQNYIVEICLDGISNLRKTGDMGIDGFTKDHIPIQVKQSKITRPIVDQFEIAIDRYYNQLGNQNKIKEGILVGDDIPSHGVFAEMELAKQQRDIHITFISIKKCCDILNDRLRQMEIMEGWYEQKQKKIVK